MTALAVVDEYQAKYKLPVYLENGTGYGDMLSKVVAQDQFNEYHGIELSEERIKHARKKFSTDSRVYLYLGRSDLLIGEILTSVYQPCLCFLHGHHRTLRFDLKEIFGRPWGHVILIDGAKAFDTRIDVPSLAEIQYIAAGASYDMDVQDDIIRLTKDPRFS